MTFFWEPIVIENSGTGRTRRQFLKGSAIAGVGLALTKVASVATAADPATAPAAPPPAVPDASAKGLLRWLDNAPPLSGCGMRFGVPWARGTAGEHQMFHLEGPDKTAIPTQCWPLAYWPDGSLKWTGLGIAADAKMSGPFRVVAGASPPPDSPLVVKATDQTVEVSFSSFSCTIPRSGADIISSLVLDGYEVARNGRLIAVREDRSQESSGVLRQETFNSLIQSVTVEQGGPVCAVVKIEGVHAASQRQWLPFAVRLYFTAGVESIKLVHSFVFDGDAKSDFIRGLGIVMEVPFREERQNRHVRFASDDDGVWGEPVLMSPGYREVLVPEARAMNADQLIGKRIPNLNELGDKRKNAFESVAVWDGFKLAQLGPDSFSLRKRTGAASSWLQVFSGKRARGTVFLGDVSGGVAAGIKKFWQKYPSSIEINGAGTAEGELTLWLWSPEASAMDLRHYDTIGHDGKISYEDYTEGFSTPTGVANTSELTLWAMRQTPSNESLSQFAKTANEPPLIVCSPDYYHSTETLGVWSLPDRSTPETIAVEKQLDDAFQFYQAEVDARRWYGFWDYGDVMRTYDSLRHTWMYDIGGHAWNNTELMPNAWLWFSFLRTGRADIFRFAEAMTRNTSEVDVYHMGEFKGLGSRHNVSHWGCGAKEARISESFLKRFYYYITTDERTGDLMRETLDVDHTVDRIQPLRKEVTRGSTPIIRIGPDWLAFASNWMTEWERTGNTQYRDYVLTGMKCIGAMPDQFLKLQGYRYDSNTKQMFDIGKPNNPQGEFLDLFGGDQIAMDLIALIPCPEFETAWNQLCASWASDPKWKGYTKMRISGYTAALKTQAWDLLKASVDPSRPSPVLPPAVEIKPPIVAEVVQERAGVNTPGVSQWAINVITTMQFARRFNAEPRQ